MIIHITHLHMSRQVKEMSIANYFKPVPKPSKVVSTLESVTNREKEEIVKTLKEVEEKPKKRGKYRSWTVIEKIEIGKYAIRNGVSATLRHYSTKFPGISKFKMVRRLILNKSFFFVSEFFKFFKVSLTFF